MITTCYRRHLKLQCLHVILADSFSLMTIYCNALCFEYMHIYIYIIYIFHMPSASSDQFSYKWKLPNISGKWKSVTSYSIIRGQIVLDFQRNIQSNAWMWIALPGVKPHLEMHLPSLLKHMYWNVIKQGHDITLTLLVLQQAYSC